jgi:hypothetical protein
MHYFSKKGELHMNVFLLTSLHWDCDYNFPLGIFSTYERAFEIAAQKSNSPSIAEFHIWEYAIDGKIKSHKGLFFSEDDGVKVKEYVI